MVNQMNAEQRIDFEQAEYDRRDQLSADIDKDCEDAMRAIRKLSHVEFDNEKNKGYLDFESCMDARIDSEMFSKWNKLFSAFENNDPMITVYLDDFMAITRAVLEEEAQSYAEDKNGAFK